MKKKRGAGLRASCLSGSDLFFRMSVRRACRTHASHHTKHDSRDESERHTCGQHVQSHRYTHRCLPSRASRYQNGRTCGSFRADLLWAPWRARDRVDRADWTLGGVAAGTQHKTFLQRDNDGLCGRLRFVCDQIRGCVRWVAGSARRACATFELVGVTSRSPCHILVAWAQDDDRFVTYEARSLRAARDASLRRRIDFS